MCKHEKLCKNSSHNGLGVKNMSDPILKEIYGKYETKNLTKEQIKRYKMTEREIFLKSMII